MQKTCLNLFFLLFCLASIYGCGPRNSTQPLPNRVSMTAKIVKISDGTADIRCSFKNTTDHSILVGENIRVDHSITTKNSFEAGAGDICPILELGHYIMLPARSVKKENKGKSSCHETLDRNITIKFPNEYSSDPSATIELSSEIEFLEYDSQTNDIRSKQEIARCKIHFSTTEPTPGNTEEK